MPTTPSDLDELQALDRPSLLARWEAAYGEPPPISFYSQRLIRGIAHREQVTADPELQRIAKVVRRRLQQAPASPKQKSYPRLHPGARLLREWGNTTHEVTVTETGFTYRSRAYKSLSQIAREITGTRWSGPAFFGVKK
jgi:signal recognition particle subunit SEC65